MGRVAQVSLATVNLLISDLPTPHRMALPKHAGLALDRSRCPLSSGRTRCQCVDSVLWLPTLTVRIGERTVVTDPARRPGPRLTDTRDAL